MKDTAIKVPDRSPLWRRVVDFPLVAMALCVGLFILTSSIAGRLGKLLPQLGPNGLAIAKTAITVGLMFTVYKLVMVRLGQRPRDDLKAAAAPKGLLLGYLIGSVLFCAVVASAALFGVYRIVGPGDARELVKDLTGMMIGAAFMEELLFRGILFRWIEDFAGSCAALAVTAALFGLGHLINPNATWASSLAIAVEAGVMLGAAYMMARNLWLPIGLHAAWNFTQGFIFDVPVSGEDVHGIVQAKLSGPVLLSGGAFGLEGSIIGVLLCIVPGVAFIALAVRRGNLAQPWWVRRREQLVER